MNRYDHYNALLNCIANTVLVGCLVYLAWHLPELIECITPNTGNKK